MHIKKIVSFIALITLLLPSCTIYLPSASAVVGGGYGGGGGGCNSGRPVMMQEGGRPVVMQQGGRRVVSSPRCGGGTNRGGYPVGSMGLDMNPNSRYFEGRYQATTDTGYNPNIDQINYTSGGRTVRVGRF